MSILENSQKGGENSRFDYNFKTLLGLQKIADNTQGNSALLNSILAAIKAHQDMEILLVRDEGNNDLVVQQIREYDEETGTWLLPYYQKVDGSVYQAPELVGPLVYLDADGVLNLILAELLDQGLTLDSIEALLIIIDGVLDAIKIDTANLDVPLSTRASEATLLSTNALLTTIDTVLDAIQTDTAAMVVDLAAIEVLIATTNSLLTIIDGVLDNIEVLLTPAVRTHNTVLATLPGFIPAGSISGSVFNSGNQPAGWNGIIIPAGVTIPWGPVGNRDTYGVINYDPTISGPGTTLIIEYTT